MLVNWFNMCIGWKYMRLGEISESKSKLSTSKPWRLTGELRETHSWPPNNMEASEPRYTPPALLPWKKGRQYQSNRKLGGPQLVWTVCLLPLGIEPRFLSQPVHSIVLTPTTLSQLVITCLINLLSQPSDSACEFYTYWNEGRSTGLVTFCVASAFYRHVIKGNIRV
jgi:hypothetical protein